MRKRPEKKRWHIGAIVLLLLTIVGIWQYSRSPPHLPKDHSRHSFAPLSSARGVSNTIAPSPANQVHSWEEGAVCVDNIANVALLVFFWWLSSDYARHPPSNLTLTLSPLQYVAAALLGMAMMGYTVYFFYQQYILQQLPYAVLAKDIGLFGGMGFLTSVVFYPAFFTWMQEAIDDDEELSSSQLKACTLFPQWPLLQKIFGCYTNLIVYTLARKLITYLKSHQQISSQKFDSTWLLSIVLLASTWGIMVDPAAWSLRTKLLWTIPACFLYAHAFWEPQFQPIRHRKIGPTLAWLTQPCHLWQGLGVVFSVYYLKCSGYAMGKKWLVWKCGRLVWACFKWGFLYHLEIKKASSTEAGYTVSFPLSFRGLLEGGGIILLGAYRPLSLFLPIFLASRWKKGLYIALLLMGGLWISMYLHTASSPMGTWTGHLAYGLISISGSLVVGYDLWRANGDDPVTKRIVAATSFLVLVLYILPKSLHRIAKASLALQSTSASFQKRARTLQAFTSCWLHPDRGVLYTTILTAALGMLYAYTWRGPQLSLPTFINQIAIIYTIALACYGMLAVWVYNFSLQKKIANVIAYTIFFAAFAGSIQLAYFPSPGARWDIALLCSLIGYIAVAVLVQTLRNILKNKGYKKAILPAFDHIERLLYPPYAYLLRWGLHRLALLQSFALPARAATPGET